MPKFRPTSAPEWESSAIAIVLPKSRRRFLAPGLRSAAPEFRRWNGSCPGCVGWISTSLRGILPCDEYFHLDTNDEQRLVSRVGFRSRPGAVATSSVHPQGYSSGVRVLSPSRPRNAARRRLMNRTRDPRRPHAVVGLDARFVRLPRTRARPSELQRNSTPYDFGGAPWRSSRSARSPGQPRRP
jgi:hypothetical protein